MLSIFLVGLGGGLGSILRYLTSSWVHRWLGTHFYLGTLIVNLLGCFLVGIFIGLIEKLEWGNTHLRLLLIVGFCGGFTTFSALSMESFMLIKSGHFFQTLLYNAVSILLGISAVWAGASLMR